MTNIFETLKQQVPWLSIDGDTSQINEPVEFTIATFKRAQKILNEAIANGESGEIDVPVGNLAQHPDLELTNIESKEEKFGLTYTVTKTVAGLTTENGHKIVYQSYQTKSKHGDHVDHDGRVILVSDQISSIISRKRR